MLSSPPSRLRRREGALYRTTLAPSLQLVEHDTHRLINRSCVDLMLTGGRHPA